MNNRGNIRSGASLNWHIVGYTLLVLFVALLTSALIAHPAGAATTVPTKMNFQGRLTDASGTVVADGLYNMKFAIYDDPTAGTQQWTETRQTTNRVQVTNGIFSVKLGDVTPLPASVFSAATRYFEITLANPATATCSTASCQTWESAMTRNQIATSAYAYNADTLDGIDGASFAQYSTTNAFTGTNSITVSNANAFVVAGAYNLFRVDTSGTQVLVGTTDANANLFVLDTKNTPGDPTGVAGGMYYNSDAGKLRCYEVTTWKDCVAADTLQTAYNNSSSPATITTSAAGKGIVIAAGVVPTTDLMSISNAGYGVTTAGVSGLSVDYVGGAAAIESSGVRIDYAPGTTSGGTWSGLQVIANATGAASGVTAYGIKIEGPASPGSGSEVGLHVAGGFDIGVDIASGSLQLAAVSNEPASPAAGNMKVYAKEIAGRMILKSVGPTGLDTPYQPALFANNVAMILPSTSTTITVWGMPNTTVGTASTPTIANTNFKTAMRRVLVTSATTANSASELRSAQMLVWRGNAAGLGGFFYAARFSVNSTTANQRLFSGLISSTAATSTSVAPSAIVNMIGVGWDSADANLQIMSNNSSGTATKVDLGSGYPANTTTAVYELILYAPPNASTVGYRVQRLDNGTSTSGTISTDLPANNLMLSHHQYMNNGGTAAAVALEVNRVYVESDY